MKRFLQITIMMLAIAGCGLLQGKTGQAAVHDIQVSSSQIPSMETSTEVHVGDTGRIQPLTDGLVLTEPVARWEYVSYDEDVIRVDQNGSYQALSTGSTTIAVTGYSQYGVSLFTGYCRFTVTIDMTNVVLETDHLSGYFASYGSYTGSVRINSQTELSDYNSEVTVVVDNPDMSVSCELAANELRISTSSPGSCKLTVTINGKAFEIWLKVSQVEISRRSYVGSRGKKLKLKIRGTGDKPVWTSSNKKVVKVSSDGTIRCRKKGNAVITASFGEVRVGCAVSVVSAGLVKVVKRATYIGSHWKYSQPKRMQNGYYDCSSLVWKSYKKIGKKFGSSGYAPVAADLAKWTKAHGKVITRSYTRNHIQKMKLRPGDLMFETGKNNGRYKGIYHVEMFTGYAVSYYDESGKPVLLELWGARPEGYYGGGHLIERP